MIEFHQSMGKRIHIQRKRMSYGEYGFTKRSEVQSSYQEYSCKPREDKQQSYSEYGDPKMSGTGSLFGSTQGRVDLKAFDDEIERYCEQQRKIRAERLADRAAYCDEHDIQGDIREKILKGRISIEEFEALQKETSEWKNSIMADEGSKELLEEASAALAPFLVTEQPAEESAGAQTDVTTAEPETVQEQPQTGKKKKSREKSKKKTEEVSDAE